MSSDPVQPRQDYPEQAQQPKLDSQYNARKTGGGGSTTAIIGVVMLIAGIALSMAPTGRIFIGLIIFGIINIVRGLARG
jgi:uncharacterized membrane protein HdeD (DUF308 family)